MSPEPSTTVSSAAHSGAEYNEEYLREVIETASGFMLSQHDIVVPGEFKRHNISNQHRSRNPDPCTEWLKRGRRNSGRLHGDRWDMSIHSAALVHASTVEGAEDISKTAEDIEYALSNLDYNFQEPVAGTDGTADGTMTGTELPKSVDAPSREGENGNAIPEPERPQSVDEA